MSRRADVDALVERLLADPRLRHLDARAWRLARTRLFLLFPGREGVLRVHPVARRPVVPEFCALVQSTESGRHRCEACRSLAVLRASSRGLLLHTCHGRLSAFTAPAGRWGDRRVPFVLVGTCALRGAVAGGWRGVRESLGDLPIETAALRRAYDRLPLLPARAQAGLGALVRQAAAIVDARLLGGRSPAGAPPLSASGTTRLLRASADGVRQERRGARGRAVADAVTALVLRQPAAPLTVKRVSWALGLTPNHFSALFRRHTGQPFNRFLFAARLAEAKRRLARRGAVVADVAAHCGFAQAGYFSRRFRAATGRSPTQWRAAGARRDRGR
jgi:AraC-like DNA-binding protein